MDVVVASVQSLGRPDTSAKRLAPYIKTWTPRPSSAQQQCPHRDVLLVVDEAHHIAPQSTYDTVLSHFGLGSAAAPVFKGGGGATGEGPRAFLFGFTATPFRWVCGP